ncbi:MAG TPA: hypothetical protein VMU81_13115 [Acetobacteraceae bacterium]|nr:hypothetical protein [Acetobacteraceae bacterium]
MPRQIGEVLEIARILLGYGRHLADTIQRRSVRRGFSALAQFFGTANVLVILAHVYRGVMRAVALERLLLDRAARGRDLVSAGSRACSTRGDEQAETKDPVAKRRDGPAPADTPPPSRPAPHRGRRDAPEPPLTLDNLPSMRQVEAEVRRRPIGRTLVAICNDLGVAPLLCSNLMWQRLYDAFALYRGSFSTWYGEMRRRRTRFIAKEVETNPDLGFPAQVRDEIQRFLGFLVGDPLVDLLPEALVPAGAPMAPAATGPP